jgi:hypothetical protein
MTAITFDTLKFTKRLKASGFTEAQAEGFAEAQRETFEEVLDSTLATKGDISNLRNDTRENVQGVKDRLMGIESEMKLMKWMIGTTLAAVIAILVRLFIK